MIAFFHRVAPTVLVEQLMRDLGATALGVGLLSAVYFYVYMAMQIPAGILTDRFGPRLVVACGSAVAAAGSALFAVAAGVAAADAGRVVIGLGVSTAFVGMMKFNAAWFPPRQYGTASGLVMVCGNLGAVLGATPLAWLLTWIDWRTAFSAVAVVSLLVTLLILAVVRDTPEQLGYCPTQPRARPRLRRGWPAVLAEVATTPAVWPHALALGTVVGSFFAFTGLWAVPMLVDVYGLSRPDASRYVTIALVVFALGGFAAGWMSDHLGRRKPLLVFGAALSALGYLAVLLLPWSPGPTAALLFCGNGLGAATMVVSYTSAKENVDPAATGMAIAFVNSGLFLGAAILQPAFGWLLEAGTQAGAATTDAYANGLWLLFAACLFGLLIIQFGTTDRCQQP